MLELLRLLGFRGAQAAGNEPLDSGNADSELPDPPWTRPLADEALLAELVIFHRAAHC